MSAAGSFFTSGVATGAAAAGVDAAGAGVAEGWIGSVINVYSLLLLFDTLRDDRLFFTSLII